jgi:integrase
MNLAARSVTFWDVPLRLLRRSHIELWVKEMQTSHRGNGRGESQKAGLEPSTIHTRFVNVRTVLRGAIADKRLAADPSVGVKLPRVRRPEAAMRLPTVEQVRVVLAAADPYFRPFIALCAFAGLRLGEAAALQVGDIDFADRTLTVTRQVQRAGGHNVEIRAPKFGSEREVYLPDNLILILRRRIKRLPKGSGPTSWLFKGENGNPPHQNTVGYWWRKAMRDAGVSGIRLHDLRHFFASGLIASGCDVVTVQRALGHSSATVTLNTYSHLWPSAEDRTRQAAASMLADVLRQPDEFLTNDDAA